MSLYWKWPLQLEANYHPLFPEVICQNLASKGNRYLKRIYQRIVEAFLKVYPTFEDRKSLAYDYAVILEKAGKLQEAVRWFRIAGLKEIEQFRTDIFFYW